MRTTDKQLRGEEKPSVDCMRYDIAEAEAMNMNTSDIINLLMDGFEGLECASDQEVIEEWNNIFADETN